MSVKNETKKVEEEVVVNEVKTTDLVEVEKEAKKPLIGAKAKKVLKVAGVALVGGVLGYFLGSKTSSSNDSYDISDEVEYEVVEETDAE